MDKSVSVEVKFMFAFGNGEKILTPEESRGLSPPDPEKFCYEFHVFIGRTDPDAKGNDSFDVTVCSPSWFADRVATGNWDRFNARPRASILTATGIWFMRRWDRTEFEAALDDLCREVSPGPNYGAVADRLSRFLWWEYDYRFDELVNRGES